MPKVSAKLGALLRRIKAGASRESEKKGQPDDIERARLALEAYRQGSFAGLQEMLDGIGETGTGAGRLLEKLSDWLMGQDILAAAEAARRAYAATPTRRSRRWLAKRLLDCGCVSESLEQLGHLGREGTLSATEVKRKESAEGLLRLEREKPDLTGPALPDYEVDPDTLLYVAASSRPFHETGYTLRTHAIVTAMAQLGRKVTVLTRPGYPWDRSDVSHPPETPESVIDGISYRHLPAPLNTLPLDVYAELGADAIAREARDLSVAVIHAASNHVNALPALLAARRLGLPFHYEMRGIWELSRASKVPGFERTEAFALATGLEGFIAAQADRLFVISEQLAEYTVENWKIDPARIELMPNGVDEAIFASCAGEAPGTFTIGYAGAMVPYEGLDLLIDAVAMLAGKGVTVRLVVMGDGESRPALELRAAEAGVGAQVEFLGRVTQDEARRRLRAASMVCIPRRGDRVCEIIPPLKLHEAMALGLPVLVPDLPVFRSEVEDGVTGLFFRAGDAADLAERIGEACDSANELARIGRTARSYVKETRTWDAILDRCALGRLWHVNRGRVSVETNLPERFCGVVGLSGKEPGYVILGMASASFGRLPEGGGLPVETNELHIIQSRCKIDGAVDVTKMVLEYDAGGNRIGTAKMRGDAKLYYIPRAEVERIVVCLRLDGEGTATIEDLAWRRDTRLFREGLLPASRPSIRPGGPGIIWLPEGDGQPATIWPNDFVRLCALGVKAGSYAFEFAHRDPLMGMRESDFEARLVLANPLPDTIDSAVLGIARVADDTFAIRPALRSRENGAFHLGALFSLPQDQDWLVIELSMGVDRLLNLDSLGFRPDSGDLSGLDENIFAPEVASFLDRLEDRDAITSVLYADINMNLVDGSSIWLSSAASMLAGQGRCILVSSHNIDRDIIRSNIRHMGQLTILTPADVDYPLDRFEVAHACAIIRRLDDRLPSLRNVVVRGCAAAEQLLSTRQFRLRAFPYLTDFYEIGEGRRIVPQGKRRQVAIVATHAARLLVQTRQIGDALEEIACRPFERCYLPPSIPPVEVLASDRAVEPDAAVRIGYAGKINPQWGILELLDWVGRLREAGTAVELHIASGKISDRSGNHSVPGMRERILSEIAGLGGHFHEDLNREQSMSLMAGMDYVWCWRPATLEKHTLELSTKLVEMVSCGARCICYPNAINQETLGADYPFYARDFDDFSGILDKSQNASPDLASHVRERFSQDNLGHHLAADCLNSVAETFEARRICFAGHDFKFIDPYVSRLKAAGHEVLRDVWNWGDIRDPEATRRCVDWADIVFCEWGLANAVWYSQNRREGQRLYIRAHLQEVNQRAQKFGKQIDIGNVDKVIFVSERVRDTAVELFGWPVDKTIVIPNFVLCDEYAFTRRTWDGPIRLGMVGIVPERKRFDRAVDLLAELIRRGHDALLEIKGPRPETLPFMFAAGRTAELQYYFDLYERIESDPSLAGKVSFAPWGNDVSAWYGQVDHILSCSDFESFHYALADGVLSGCHPLVWPWEEAEKIYTPDWLVADVAMAADRIEAFRASSPDDRMAILRENRALIERRYGDEVIFRALDGEIGVKV